MTQPFAASTPEGQGVCSSAILNMLNALEGQNLEIHGFILLRHGFKLAEGAWSPFSLDKPHALYSVSKSFTSSAVGLAVAEGLLSISDTVLQHFPEYAPLEPSPHLAAMTVRDLLTMTTGHAEDMTAPLLENKEQPWAKTFLEQPVEYAPGTHFMYNSAATHMLAALLERLSGQSLLEYLRPRLLNPLGITGAIWDTNDEGTALGGWGLNLPLEGLARLGQLYLQEGVWEGGQILSSSWVREATAAQVPNGESESSSDWAQGYGYQFWRCQHGAYRADGSLGQFIVVMPQQGTVLAINSAVNDMQAILNQVWTHLLPALQAAPLEPNPSALEQLRQKCQHLSVPVVQGQMTSPLAARVAGQNYRFEPNEIGLERLHMDTLEGRVKLEFHDSAGAFSLEAGLGTWLEGQTRFGIPKHQNPSRVAVCVAWTSEDQLELHINRLGLVGTQMVHLQFLGDRIRLERTTKNTIFAPTPLFLHGTLEKS